MFMISVAAYTVGIVCLGQALYSNHSVALSFFNRIEKTSELIDQFMSKTFSNSTVQMNKNNSQEAYYQDNNKICLILSGADVAKVGISEARYMFKCIQKKISQRCRSQVEIFLDEKSTNTMDNALNCCEIISELTRTHCLDHIFLVTNEFHMPRAHILFKSALKRRQNPQLHPVPAENGLAAGNEYRPLSHRPADANEWTLRERLDWEWGGLCSLQSFIQSPEHDSPQGDNNSSSHGGQLLLSIRQEDLDAAMDQIRKLNQTSSASTRTDARANLHKSQHTNDMHE